MPAGRELALQFGSRKCSKCLPDELLDREAASAPPLRFLEAAIGFSAELHEVEVLWELPPISVGVMYSPVRVVLDDDRGRIRFLQILPDERCQYLDSIRDRSTCWAFDLCEDSDSWSWLLWLVEPQVADRLYAVIALVVPGAIVNDLGGLVFFQTATSLS